MSYGKFKTIAEVARKFSLTISEGSFIEEKPIKIPEYEFNHIVKALNDRLNYINETTICEKIISRMLNILDEFYPSLRVWSHVPYNVKQEEALVGSPDYLVAPVTQYGDMGIPPLCIIEAKKDDFDDGWAQALAEMVAASYQGAEICYAAVTTGVFWQFGKLESRIFTQEHKNISATDNTESIFNTLNWLFFMANKLANQKN